MAKADAGRRGARMTRSKDQARSATHTPEQTPDGPVPCQLPLSLTLVNLPMPTAWRGPATPLILVAPEPEMRPSRKILCMTKRPLVAEMWPLATATPILMMPQWPLVVVSTIFQLPSKGEANAGAAKARRAVERAKTRIRLPIIGVLMRSCPARQCEPSRGEAPRDRAPARPSTRAALHELR